MPRSPQPRSPTRYELSRRPEIDATFVATFRRRRIIDAAAAVIAEQGYAATTVSDIVRRAGVARKTLYEQFDGKDELFLATFDTGAEEGLRRVEEAGASASRAGWAAQVRAGLAALLGYVAEQPGMARACIVEAPAAGGELAARYEVTLSRFATLLAAVAPRSEELPETIEETLVGGVAWIVHRLVRGGEAERALDLLPGLTDFVLAPFELAGIRSA